MKKWILLVSAMCLAFVVAACGASSNNSGSADSANLEPDLVIQTSNWKFDQEEYTINAGEQVNIKVESLEGVHDVQISKTKFKIRNNKTVAVTIDKPGTYKIICTLPCGTGHSQMVATLTVV